MLELKETGNIYLQVSKQCFTCYDARGGGAPAWRVPATLAPAGHPGPGSGHVLLLIDCGSVLVYYVRAEEHGLMLLVSESEAGKKVGSSALRTRRGGF